MTEVIHAEGIPVDSIRWWPKVKVDKWSPDQVAYAGRRLRLDREPTHEELLKLIKVPDDVARAEGNLLTTAGLARISSLIQGAGGQGATATATRIGVGDTNTAAAIGNTDLAAAAGSTHRFFMTMNTSYPQFSNGVQTYQAIFGTSDGNFTGGWQEWCIDIGTPTVTSGTTVNACMLNRAVASLGTKVAGAIWTFTTTITIA